MHFGCAARVRDRRQTLFAWHGFGLFLTCLATSYCNIAAPLVCLDLLGHVVSIFFQGTGSREAFDFQRPGPDRGRYKARSRSAVSLDKVGASPEAREVQRLGARSGRESTWLAITNFARY